MKRSGFTLIELLIATTIIFLLIFATSQAIIFSLALKLRSEAGLAAADAARTRLEYLKSQPFDSRELTAGEYSSSLPFKKNSAILVHWSIRDVTAEVKFIELESSAENILIKKTAVSLYKLQALGF